MEFLDNHEFINYTQRVIRHAFDHKYRQSVLNVGKPKEDYFYIEHLGEKNIGKIIYLYEVNDKYEVGFFAFYRYLIEICYLCEMYGFIPVVQWGRDFPYSEFGKEINGETECFLHFFKQISDISAKDANESFAVIRSTYWHRDKARRMLFGTDKNLGGYIYNVEYFRKLATYSKKYINLNPIIEKTLNNDIQELLNEKKTLGVHVRIKTFSRGINNHPIASGLDEYIDAARKALNNGFEQIFLATEELDSVKAFTEEFGDKVLFYSDVFRTKEGDTIVAASNRSNHKYLFGYEVLRDMNTLAKCDGLIAGLSQVSFCSIVTKYEAGRDYEYIKLFDNGVSKSNYTLNRAYNKYKK